MIQNQVLNKILQTKDPSLILLNNLDNTFFSDYQEEFDFIYNHYQQYNNIPDIETFLSKFINFDVVKVEETDKYLIDELYKDKNKIFLANTFNEIRKHINNDDIEKALEVYQNSTDKLVKAKHLEAIDLVSDTSRYDAYLEKANDFSKYYVKTGLAELDAIIGGWDRKEELATLVARTGVGKTWCLLKTALTAAQQGLTVGIYSGEMSANKIGYRIDTLLSHLSNTCMLRGNTSIQNDYKRYLESLNTQIKGKLIVITPDMINGTAGVRALQAFIEKYNLDILCIDQHSLLEDDRRAKNPVERAANISKDLKNLQVLKRIPIIAVSQQNRQDTDNGVSTAHIAQSDRIAQDSTTIIFFEQKKDEDIMTLNIVKARDGGTAKKLFYSVNFDKGIFEYIPSEEDGLQGASCESLKEEFDFVPEQEGDVF